MRGEGSEEGEAIGQRRGSAHTVSQLLGREFGRPPAVSRALSASCKQAVG